MKSFLLCLALALGLASSGLAIDFQACDVQPGDLAVGTDPQAAFPAGSGCKVTENLFGHDTIKATIFAVNVSTGALDNTATSASTFVLQYKDCLTCPWQSFPKPGDAPVTNIGGGQDAAPSRSFKVPPRTQYVRWKPLTLGSGRVKAIVSY